MAENPKVPVVKAVPKPKVVAAKPVAAKPVVAKAAAAEPAKKTTQKTPAKPAVKKVAKPAKPVKVKTVRDTFSMPAPGYALLMQIKKHCRQDGLKVKKGELLCAGLGLLAKLPPAELAKALQKA